MRCEPRHPAEKILRFFRADGLDWELQAPPDRLRNVTHRHAFLCDRVILRVRLGLLDRQAVEAGSVENMRRRPAVESFPDIRARALLAIHLDHGGDEALP